MIKVLQELKTVFKTIGNNHIYKNKRTIIKSIALWAFFDPLGNINRLPIALVNNDTATDRIINRHNLNLDDVEPNSSGAYQFKINDLQISNEKKTFTVYYDDDGKTYYQHQNDKTFLTEIMIDKDFTSDFYSFFNQALKIVVICTCNSFP